MKVVSCHIADLEVGPDMPPLLIAGPCAIENRESALRHAEAVRDMGRAAGFQVVYKSSFDKANRTSISAFRGVGMEAGLEILAEVRREIGVPVLTDIHESYQAAIVGAVCDVLQIPAFLCRQTDLLVAAAATGRAVNVKKGQFLPPEQMGQVVGKLEAAGCQNMMLTERGTTFGYGSLVVDFRALPILRGLGRPVVFDGTHSVQRPGGLGDRSGGDRREVPALVRAAAAVGVDGFFLEMHEDPDRAPSDGPNMLALDTVPPLLAAIQRLRAAIA